MSWKMNVCFDGQFETVRLLMVIVLQQKFLSMKTAMYRQFAQNRSPLVVDQNTQTLTNLLDHKLHYINRSFEHNLKIQQIYLDLIKSKKTIQAKELKQYYLLFTDSKAESLMFNHNLHDHTEDIWLSSNNKQMLYSLKRLYCRLIEKTMIKISYYLMNKKYLNFIFNPVNELIKRCEMLMRRLNYMKDMGNINQVVEKIYEQNEEIQEKIIEELINRGYINSVDQFYRINGIDLDHREYYERNSADSKTNSDSNNAQNPAICLQKFEIDLNQQRKVNGLAMKRENKKGELNKVIHRSGIIEMENKYKSLIVNLESLLDDDIEEIVQAKQKEQNDENRQIILDSQELQGQNQPENTERSVEMQKTCSSTSQPILKKSSMKDRIKLKKLESKNELIAQENPSSRSELHCKQINIPTFNSSSSMRADGSRKSKRLQRKDTTPFFSNSFVNAIKSIERSNFIEGTNRISIKRMSEHIISFQRQSQIKSQFIEKNQKDQMSKNIKITLRKNNEKKSIIKLLNIYKNKTIGEFVGNAEKEYAKTQQGFFNSCSFSKKNIIRSQESRQFVSNSAIGPASPFPSNNFQQKRQKRTSRFGSLQSLLKANITRNTEQFEDLKKSIQNTESNVQNSEFILSNYHLLKQKIRLSTKTPVCFSNPRLSNRLQQQTYTSQFNSLKHSPQRQTLDATSILTSTGIESVRLPKECIANKKAKLMSKTTLVSPISSPILPHFEVYDRMRRVILR